MQERIEEYLKEFPYRWSSAEEISKELNLKQPTVLHGIMRLFKWGVVEKKYEYFKISKNGRCRKVYVRIKKEV